MKITLLFYTFLLFYITGNAQVSINQVDNFEDNTTQNWRIGGAGAASGPINVGNGGPAGSGDNFLQYTSTGTTGAASKMVIFNQNNQWSGDYTSAGVDEITFSVRAETNPLNLRIAFEGAGNKICTTNAVAIPANGSWTTITIPISASDFTLIEGSGDASSTLASVLTMRFLSSSAPTWDAPDIIAAVLQIDNITASTSLSVDDFVPTGEFTISPNPSRNKLNVKLSRYNESLKLEVFDVLGKKVYMGKVANRETTVNVSNWKSGVYLVRISNDNVSQTKRFIKL
ncbi:MAG: T9SS type A sorting domain-containing protein [Winogradskyella sp.]|nr:T9SS type A sorting domain-containing protein [Winogradskyella sp.]